MVAVLLDLDDTLVDSTTAMIAAGRAAAATLWPQAGADLHDAAARRFRTDPRGLFGAYTRGELDFAAMRRARVADLVDHLGLADIDDAHRQFEAAYAPAFAQHLRAYDDVAGLLAEAGERHWRVGVLTNSGATYTAEKLRLAGLVGRFDVVVTTDDLGYGKPDPRVFAHACALLGSEPADTAYVGDDLEVDARGARAAGLYAVWLSRAPGSPQGGGGRVPAEPVWDGPRVSTLAGLGPVLSARQGPGRAPGEARGADLGTGAGGR